MGGTRRFVRVKTGDRVLEQLQDRIEEALDRLDRRVLVTGVSMPAGAAVTVRHPLQRLPTGWAIVRAQGGYPQAYETARTAEQITLQSANACTVDLEFW